MVSNGRDFDQIASWSSHLMKIKLNYKVTVVINSNVKLDLNDYKNSPFNIIYYPSNRVIEPQIILVQLLKYFQIDILYMITQPEIYTLHRLPECPNIFTPISSENNVFGVAINRKKLLANSHQIPNIINSIRELI